MPQLPKMRRAPRELNGDDVGCWIQAPQVTGIACQYRILPLSCKDYHRRVDNIRRVGGAAEFSARTGKLFIKRNDRYFLAP